MLVPPREKKIVNGRIYRAGDELPEEPKKKTDIMKKKPEKPEKPEKGVD